MSKTNVTIRIDSDIKRECEAIFEELGVSLSEAINVFLHMSIQAGGFPFDLRLRRPNRETAAALMESETIAQDPNAKRYHSVAELFSDLERDEDE